jgi:hypothetical protein
MLTISTNEPILKIQELQTEFDLITVSNSLVRVLQSYEEARIVQQLHSWIRSGQGIVIEGHRWFDKSIQDWITEVLPTASDWKMRSYMSSLVSKGVLKRKKLFKKHHGHNFSPKNQTYYYRLDYEELSLLALEAINSEKLNNAGGEE